MSISVTNCGSSSLRYQLIDSASEVILAKRLCERIGIEGSQTTYQPVGGKREVTVSPTPTYTQAIQMVLDALTNDETGVIKSLDEVEAVGHRIVYGGEAFIASTLIMKETVRAIEGCSGLTPLHNPVNLIDIRACQGLIPNTPMVGVFDTAFHQIIPKKTYLYELPYEYYEKYKVRRYDFHETSHSYVSKKTAGVLGRPYDSLKTVVCHLGNGSSISAILNRESMGTSMGLTPLEGLVIGTRSGDVGPGALQFIMHKKNIDIDQILSMPNKKSGVYGMSDVSNDLHDVENAANDGNKKAEVTLESFAYRVIKYMEAYAATMNSMDVTAFTTSVGENDKATREKVCGYSGFLGVEIDDEANSKRGQEIVVSIPGSRVSVLVAPTNEELTITRETPALVK